MRELIPELLFPTPAASLYEGAAGVAFVSAWSAATDPGAAQTAVAMSDYARQHQGDHLDLMRGRAGVAFVESLVGLALKDDVRVRRGVASFTEAWRAFSSQTNPTQELGWGTAGFCAAANTLKANGLRHSLIDEVERESLAHLLSDFGRGLDALGFLHGRAGILFTILKVRPDFAPEVHREYVEMRAHSIRRGSFRVWPVSTRGDTDGLNLMHRLCAGIPGHLLLTVQLAKLLSSKSEREEAENLCLLTDIGAQSRSSLCCGSAGQALGLDAASREFGSFVQQRRARRRLRLAAFDAQQEPPEARWSLMQGRLGVEWLAARHQARKPLQFPLFATLD